MVNACIISLDEDYVTLTRAPMPKASSRENYDVCTESSNYDFPSMSHYTLSTHKRNMKFEQKAL